LFFQLVSSRYEKSLIILTSNLPFAKPHLFARACARNWLNAEKLPVQIDGCGDSLAFMHSASIPGSADGASVPRVEAAYDAVAEAYSAAFENELDEKPLDRAVLTAFLELIGAGIVCDVGCGPGHVTRFLAERHTNVIGLDLSSSMIAIARMRNPAVAFEIGSMLALPVTDSGWGGLVSLYSIIHLTSDERASAWGEFARAVQPGGWLLVAFHVDSAEFGVGDVNHLTSWFGKSVDLDGYFLDPDVVATEIAAAGFAVHARMERRANGVEYPSRRCYLLAQR
jgi:SAM-dependent methyltransferase